MKILITGASGFIGSKLTHVLGLTNGRKLILVDNKKIKTSHVSLVGDIQDSFFMDTILCKYSPDIVIHCAGIAHQKIGAKKKMYYKVNSDATLKLAELAAKINPNIYFIFLSSISIYGENFISNKPIKEDSDFYPSSDYAKSKLDAETKLLKMFKTGVIKKMDILRLAPVYDLGWTLNLDKRVFGPRKLFYLKYGSGKQKMSAVSRSNVVDFIEFKMLKSFSQDSEFLDILNLCDNFPYTFQNLIDIFQKSISRPKRPVLNVPVSLIWLVTRIISFFLKNKKEWIYSCYDKITNDLVFDNSKMLETGFKPKKNLEDIFKII